MRPGAAICRPSHCHLMAAWYVVRISEVAFLSSGRVEEKLGAFGGQTGIFRNKCRDYWLSLNRKNLRIAPGGAKP